MWYTAVTRLFGWQCHRDGLDWKDLKNHKQPTSYWLNTSMFSPSRLGSIVPWVVKCETDLARLSVCPCVFWTFPCSRVGCAEMQDCYNLKKHSPVTQNMNGSSVHGVKLDGCLGKNKTKKNFTSTDREMWDNMILLHIDPNVQSPLDGPWWCMNFRFSPWRPRSPRHRWDIRHTTVLAEEGFWEIGQII